ncbi:UNVERIFIED_CONTAM: hypothetical protein Scaly_2562000 [Sesamum calycinum]|uniref:Uncharacterized protein n=1 Tax=Sesamum calycinum TaxID=2727403 RepID=A0AAW2KFD4_9LAMI
MESIVSTIPLIERGSRWKVGDGSKIRIWKDRWLPCGLSFKVYSPPRILDENARAAKLIHDDGRSWKENLVHAYHIARTIDEEERRQCSTIQISQSWISFGNPGCLTVLSCLHGNFARMQFPQPPIWLRERLMWALSNLPWGVVNNWNGGCEEWIQTCFDRLDEDDFA